MLHTQTLATYLDTLASNQPTPGGGAAAAITAAQGAALLAMVCRLTVGKKKFAAHDQEIMAALTELERYRQQFIMLAQQDTEVFQTVMLAYKLPQTTTGELTIRTEALQAALKAAAEVPFVLFTTCQAILSLADVLEQIGNPAVLSDVIVGRYLLLASLFSANANVEINLVNITDEQFCQIKREVMKPVVANYRTYFVTT